MDQQNLFKWRLISLWFGMRYSGFQAHLSIDGRTVRTDAFLIITGNTQLHGGLFRFTWQARCDDGQLDICVVRKHSLLERIVVLRDLLFQRDQRSLWVYYDTCTSVKIRTHRPIAIQIDGEPIGYTHAGTTLSIIPSILKVVAPQKTPEDLFEE